jgi:hypothetical protein
MRGRWQLILEYAPTKHDKTSVQMLRDINKDVALIAHDRNIVGLVHATIETTERNVKLGTFVKVGKVGDPMKFGRPPCWTIFRGADAGKNFPISAKAVEIIRLNVQSVAERVVAFNQSHGYIKTAEPRDQIETEWPKPL